MKVLKLAPHIHTCASDDSDWSLERLVTVLSRVGFNGALVCDHDRTMDEQRRQHLVADCDRVGDDSGFLLVPGVEYQDEDHIVHLPVFGRAPFYRRSPDIGEVITHARENGAAAFFAHPSRRDAWRRFDPAWAGGLAGIEVWNRKYDGVAPNRWALATARECGLLASVALDWHGPRQMYPLALRVADPGAGGNATRGERVIAAILARRARATVFGLPASLFATEPFASVSRAIESGRQRIAPQIRQAEAALKGP